MIFERDGFILDLCAQREIILLNPTTLHEVKFIRTFCKLVCIFIADLEPLLIIYTYLIILWQNGSKWSQNAVISRI